MQGAEYIFCYFARGQLRALIPIAKQERSLFCMVISEPSLMWLEQEGSHLGSKKKMTMNAPYHINNGTVQWNGLNLDYRNNHEFAKKIDWTYKKKCNTFSTCTIFYTFYWKWLWEHVCFLPFFTCLQAEIIEIQSGKSLMLLTLLIGLSKIWSIGVALCFIEQLQRKLREWFWRGQVTTTCCGCADRSQLSLQHLPSAGT